MHIDLPQDIVDRIQKRAAIDKLESEVEVIRKALDSLEWQINERKAIQQGIDAWRGGDAQHFDEFDAEFRARNGIQTTDP